MRRTVLVMVIGLAIVAGCERRETATTPPEPAASPPPAATTEPVPVPPADGPALPSAPAKECDATPVQRLVGEIYTPELGEMARVEAGARVERALRPGQIVTMEFLSDRLTFTLDESGRISAANCG